MNFRTFLILFLLFAWICKDGKAQVPPGVTVTFGPPSTTPISPPPYPQVPCLIYIFSSGASVTTQSFPGNTCPIVALDSTVQAVVQNGITLITSVNTAS